MKNKEIELKFVINEKIKNDIIKVLEDRGEKKSESFLIDTYYIPNFKNFEINGETIECVRIRENEKGSVLTYKKIHKEANPIYCDEFETFVSSKQQMENILFALGFSVQMIIDKKRVSYKMDNFEFDFDSVKNLGELMEVEIISENSSVEEIYNFVKIFGLSQQDVTYEGIQTLMKKAMKKK
ncbi:MAG: class IV adenylate cyclase [Clostridia bacterium]|nr:class IV adenylate cyclase [Clostridia bacterium]